MTEESSTPIPPNDYLERLRLFNEKADKLLRSTFVKRIFTDSHGFSIAIGEDRSLTVERRGADEDAIDGVSMTIRFFIQPRDKISLEHMRDLYAYAPFSETESTQINHVFDQFEREMNSRSDISHEGQHWTNRDVVENVMYGDLAHVNADKRQALEPWYANPFSKIMLFSMYEGIVADIIGMVNVCKNLNEEWLRRISVSSTSPAQSASLPTAHQPETPS